MTVCTYIIKILVRVCHFLTSGRAVGGEADFAAGLHSAISIIQKMATVSVLAMVYARQFCSSVHCPPSLCSSPSVSSETASPSGVPTAHPQ